VVLGIDDARHGEMRAKAASRATSFFLITTGDPATLFNFHHALFEESLAPHCSNDLFPIGRRNCHIALNSALDPVLPVIEVVTFASLPGRNCPQSMFVLPPR
jgi:hypothetical protein